jgi:hypothetical protein
MNDIVTLVAGFGLVATVAWANGYLVGTHLQRRAHRETDGWIEILLTDHPDTGALYDWAADIDQAGTSR